MPNISLENSTAIAKEVIELESEVLRMTASMIDKDFHLAVETIIRAKGRLVISGIGKSAHIGQKISSTMNSTGTPSLFMHASEALHGDLGMIQQDDVLLVISNSGNTPEIKALLPQLKLGKNPLIAICGNRDSALGKACDFFLNAFVEKEACPNNLAPTTSTTVQLALGDALAVALLKYKNFTSVDFAKFHPGGALGKKLYLKLEDIYPSNEKPMVRLGTPLKEIIVEMSSKRLGAVVVVDDLQSILGIITDGDLRRLLSRDIDLKSIVAEDIYSKNPSAVEGNLLAVEGLKIMREKKISQLIVNDSHNTYLGMVHIHDLNKEGIIN